ncbi:hypothetical protein SDC9_61176 [bioreactor metagenome]|uniref:SLH domain-containing protein n=1 Tax=bioreactor metagenome TaxID=1076179 RepID=A0A644XF26_9ZZZZ
MKKTVKGILPLILALTLSLTMLLPAYAADSGEAATKAAALKQLGLFQGVSDTDFALDRAPTRTEALVMLIRAMGKESEALGGSWSHPFTDVPSWADKYVGYGYEKGLTKGVSAAEFGTGNADSDMYLTFMLRALGYDDSKGDFKWDAPDTLAKAVGILPDSVDTSNFLRADVAIVSWAALEADLKTGMQRLAKKLIAENVFTGDTYTQAIAQVGETNPTAVSVSSFEALKSALSDSSVKAITIDSVGTPVAITGEVTIPAGVTVTVSRGNDFYIEGKLTNNGTINVMGADAIKTDFINYSVLSVQTGGTLLNNGAINLEASPLEETSDNGPIGGQLRVNGGTLNNKGSVFLKYGLVNTHGGMAVVIDGTFNNNGLVIVDGFFLRVDNGSFVNNASAVVINNSHIFTGDEGTFTNNGTLSGAAVSKES